MNIEALKYPIGKFQSPEVITTTDLTNWIADIEALPKRLAVAVEGLSDEQLNTPYRPEGWTIRQVVHHIADSHINSIIRFKWALTEDNPTIKPYFEDRWATLADHQLPIECSMQLLTGLHHRLTVLLRSLSEADLERTFVHPEHGNSISLKINTGMYAWHSNHHLAHIVNLKKRMNW